jgi:hypothetical protein
MKIGVAMVSGDPATISLVLFIYLHFGLTWYGNTPFSAVIVIRTMIMCQLPFFFEPGA